MKERTAQQRAAIVAKAMPKPRLGKKQERQVSELLYALGEAGKLPRLEPSEAAIFWSVIELVKRGQFTDDMRL